MSKQDSRARGQPFLTPERQAAIDRAIEAQRKLREAEAAKQEKAVHHTIDFECFDSTWEDVRLYLNSMPLWRRQHRFYPADKPPPYQDILPGMGEGG